MSVVLTPIGSDDWELLRDLRARVLSTDPDAFGSTLEEEQQYDETHWRGRLGRGYSVVAQLDELPVGLGGLFEVAPAVSMVVSMWVAPEARGQGIGQLILDDVLAAVPRENRVVLWVSDGNTAARRLYERAGFVDTGQKEPLRPGSAVTKSEMELRRSRGSRRD